MRYGPVLLVAAGLAVALATGLARHLSLAELRHDHLMLQAFVRAHPLESVLLYIGAYFLVVAFSLPGALMMSLTGGYLFGPWLGTAAAVAGASAGAVLMFLVARSAFGDVIRRWAPSGSMVERIEAGIRRGAFPYLLTLRLLPAVPFFVVNVAAGLVGVRLSTYVGATLLGLVPSTLIYTSIGSGLGRLFDQGRAVGVGNLMQPAIVAPLAALSLLALLPAGFQLWRGRGRRAGPAA